MHPFVFEIARLRVISGRGSRTRITAEVEAIGCQRVLVIASPSHAGTAAQVHQLLGPRSVGVYDKVAQHVPTPFVEACTAVVRRDSVDGLIAIGGGSAIGLAKAIALESGLPFIAVPTTYSGSEMTAVWGITTDGVKKTGKDQRVLARSVIYDSELLTTLKARTAGPSGLNALAHLVEGLYAPNANPMMSTLGQEGARVIARSLPAVCANPGDLDAQDKMLYGSCLAGILLGSTGMSLHHKLCHTLGGSFNMPHAETHAVVLPYATAFNLVAAPDAQARLAASFGTSAVAQAIWELGAKVGAPRSLRDIGFKHEDLDRAAQIATSVPYPNPRPVTQAAIRQLLEDAFNGQSPESRS
ncbi:maleylacetate reductase [Povalibacter uvarum]|uniref:Maleylacetate reductase n=1 Tax=Povalibacter uvarum TaxID=732238 RepID=A0A841HX51_9GAMM|nr:maleylacetate reductase [Povalibacter uvarum]MBB6096488.1 maleylacetate reductase [Povalibacter uvarum]